MKPFETELNDPNLEFPFATELIPVADGLNEFQNFVDKYPGFHFCPYLADKSEPEWAISTSRQYMNRILPKFLYVPVNISDGDKEMLSKCITFAEESQSIAAVNITKPHKSARVLKEYFYGSAESLQNVDTLIKSPVDHKLHPYDLNAPAFINWFEEDVGVFEGKDVIIVGAGGVGEPVAKHLDRKKPASIHIVDVKDRTVFAESLESVAFFHNHLEEIGEMGNGLIVINASGKDGISDDTGIYEFLSSREQGVFVDLRPQLQIEVVERAKELGWGAYTGNGMNARNDYELVTGIMDYMNIPESARISFSEFSSRVADAS